MTSQPGGTRARREARAGRRQGVQRCGEEGSRANRERRDNFCPPALKRLRVNDDQATCRSEILLYIHLLKASF